LLHSFLGNGNAPGYCGTVNTANPASGRVGPRVRRSGEEVRSLILDAARSQFADFGYHGTTTRDIAAKAGVSERLIYSHFDSKARLFECAVVTPFSEFMAGFVHDWREYSIAPHSREFVARRWINGMYDLLRQHRDLVIALITAAAYEDDVAKALGGKDSAMAAVHLLAEHILAAELEREGAPKEGRRLTVRLSFAMVLATAVFDGLVLAGYGRRPSRDTIVDELAALTMYGSTPPPPRHETTQAPVSARFVPPHVDHRRRAGIAVKPMNVTIGTRTEPDAVGAVEQFVAAARRCFIRDGVKRTRMEDVAREANLSRQYLYRLVPNRELLIELAAMDRAREFTEELAVNGARLAEGPDVRAALIDQLLLAISLGRDDEEFRMLAGALQRDRINHALTSSASPMHEYTSRAFEPLFRRALAEGLLRTDVTLASMVEWLQNQLALLAGRHDLDENAARTILRDYVMRGLLRVS
jgi:AcrR family transcriptional regulator